MAVQHDTDPTVDPWGAHYFSLEIGGEQIAHFSECTGLKTTTEVFEFEEGGNLAYTHKLPGYAKWENIVLKRGVSKGRKFEHWRDEYMYVPDSGWETRAMSSGAIVVRALDGSEIRRYSFNQAWPVSWEGPQFSSGGSDLAIETLEIAHEGLTISGTERPGQSGGSGGTPGGGGGGPGTVTGPPGTGPTPGTGPQGPQPGTGGGSGEIDENEAPRFKVEVSGHTLLQSDPKSGEEIVVEDHVDMLASLRVRVGSESFPWQEVRIGDTAKAWFGGSEDPIFTGVVTAVRHYGKSGIDNIEIQALDPAIKLASSRHTRFFEDVTDSDIASSVLGEAGVETGTVDSTSTSHKYVLQRSESDLSFLKRLAARNGFQLRGNNEGKIDFVAPQFSGTAIEFDREALQSMDYLVSHQNIPPNLKVYGWSYVDKELVEATASSGDIVAIGGGANGVAETGTIWQEDLYITEVWVHDQGAAQEMAVAELNRLARSFVRGRGVIAGRGDVRAGVKIKFAGFATGFNPDGYVVGSRHRVQDNVYTTEFFFESNTKPT